MKVQPTLGLAILITLMSATGAVAGDPPLRVPPAELRLRA